MKLKGHRTLLGFIVGTLLVILCIYYSREEPAHLAAILGMWCGIYGVFVGKNFMHAKHIAKKEEVED